MSSDAAGNQGMPNTRDEIVAAIERLHADSVAYWTQFPTLKFFAPIGTAWSPAHNVRHLSKSMRAVTRGLKMPKLVLRTTFGKVEAPSRSFEEMRRAYLGALAGGGQAGPFTPSDRSLPADVNAERARIMSEHATGVAELTDAINKWSDPSLDEYHLPHPLMGRITVREMLLFALYHNEHHVNTVKRRTDEETSTLPVEGK